MKRNAAMAARRMALGAAAAVFVGLAGAAGAALVTETFDTDPAARGWVGINNTSGGNSFAFVSSDGLGNNVGADTTSGEVGGLMVRSPTEASYGVSISGSLSLAQSFTASGSFDITNQHSANNG